MPSIELSEESIRKVRAFGKIIDIILCEEDSPKTDNERVELVISVGLDGMLRDVLPKEEPSLQGTMTKMFDENPDFVCGFVARAIKEGGEQKQKEQASEASKRWGMYA